MIRGKVSIPHAGAVWRSRSDGCCPTLAMLNYEMKTARSPGLPQLWEKTNSVVEADGRIPPCIVALMPRPHLPVAIHVLFHRLGCRYCVLDQPSCL